MKLLRAVAELTRASNLPTVWSNILVGLCAGYVATQLDAPGEFYLSDLELLADPWFVMGAVLLCIFGSCFYTAGMVINDVADAENDRTRNPYRPIPSGRISRRGAMLLAIALLVLGTMALIPFNPANHARLFALASLLAVSILAYNLLHRKSPVAVLFMGMCRALLVLIAGSVYGVTGRPWWTVIAPLALALFLYTAAITVIARVEHSGKQDARRYLGIVMVPIAIGPALFVSPHGRAWIPAWVAGALVCLWLAGAAAMVMTTPPRTRRAVMAWLSGICLVDMWFITLLGRPLVAALAGACFVLTTLGHRRIAGT